MEVKKAFKVMYEAIVLTCGYESTLPEDPTAVAHHNGRLDANRRRSRRR